MKMDKRFLFAAPLFLFAVGCGGGSTTEKKTTAVPDKVDPKVVAKVDPKVAETPEEAVIRTNLAKLDPEDRKLAEAQVFCAMNNEDRLGNADMGTPVKVMIKDQAVFLCCGGCKKRALADPDKTLATVATLKANAAKVQ